MWATPSQLYFSYACTLRLKELCTRASPPCVGGLPATWCAFPPSPHVTNGKLFIMLLWTSVCVCKMYSEEASREKRSSTMGRLCNVYSSSKSVRLACHVTTYSTFPIQKIPSPSFDITLRRRWRSRLYPNYDTLSCAFFSSRPAACSTLSCFSVLGIAYLFPST